MSKTPELEADGLRFQVEDLKRKLDARERELRSKDEAARGLERRFRDLNSQIKELEQRAGAFHREALDAAEELRQTQETLKVCDLARGQLSAAVERQGQEISHWRSQARALKAKVEELEALMRRRDEAVERLQKQYEDACKLLAQK